MFRVLCSEVSWINSYYWYIREGNGTPLQYSCLENPMDGGAWKAVVHRVAEGCTWLSDFTLTFRFHALEKEMATHSSVLAWRIPGMGEPDGLPSVGSYRVGHDWSNLAAELSLQILGERRIYSMSNSRTNDHTKELKKAGSLPQNMTSR